MSNCEKMSGEKAVVRKCQLVKGADRERNKSSECACDKEAEASCLFLGRCRAAAGLANLRKGEEFECQLGRKTYERMKSSTERAKQGQRVQKVKGS